MLDIKFVRTNPDAVKENIKKKFQDEKLPLVDEVIALDKQFREAKQKGDDLRAQKKTLSKQVGKWIASGEVSGPEEAKARIAEENAKIDAEMDALGKSEDELQAQIRKIMMVIPNIIDPSVPIGKDDSENVEIERFGDPFVPDFEVPHHEDIMKKLCGIDKEAAGRTSGNGFYYLSGDVARLHSSVLSYAGDFMINRGFTYYIPPFMIRSNVVTGVMSFAEMENMM